MNTVTPFSEHSLSIDEQGQESMPAHHAQIPVTDKNGVTHWVYPISGGAPWSRPTKTREELEQDIDEDQEAARKLREWKERNEEKKRKGQPYYDDTVTP